MISWHNSQFKPYGAPSNFQWVFSLLCVVNPTVRLSLAADNFILLWTRISRLVSSSEPGAHAMITCDHAFFLLFFRGDKKKSAFLQVNAISLVSSCSLLMCFHRCVFLDTFILRSSCFSHYTVQQLFSPSKKTIIMVSFAIFAEIKGPYVLA